MSSYNRHSIAHKPTIFSIWIFTKKKSLLTLALKKQKSTGHSDARTMQASPGRKAGDDREEGSTEGMLRGRGEGEAGMPRGLRGSTETGAGQPGHLKGKSASEGNTFHP